MCPAATPPFPERYTAMSSRCRPLPSADRVDGPLPGGGGPLLVRMQDCWEPRAGSGQHLEPRGLPAPAEPAALLPPHPGGCAGFLASHFWENWLQ